MSLQMQNAVTDYEHEDKDNVVPLRGRRQQIANQFPSTPPAPTPYFNAGPVEIEADELVLPGTYNGEDVVYAYDPVNAALKLAAQADFFGMCKASLWGNESEVEFGEMLRGLVVQFKPKNSFHLHLLRNIADIQWTLERASRYRKGIYDNRKAERGEHGMSAGTGLGLEYNRVASDLMKQLDRAISTYHRSVGNSR